MWLRVWARIMKRSYNVYIGILSCFLFCQFTYVAHSEEPKSNKNSPVVDQKADNQTEEKQNDINPIQQSLLGGLLELEKKVEDLKTETQSNFSEFITAFVNENESLSNDVSSLKLLVSQSVDTATSNELLKGQLDSLESNSSAKLASLSKTLSDHIADADPRLASCENVLKGLQDKIGDLSMCKDGLSTANDSIKQMLQRINQSQQELTDFKISVGEQKQETDKTLQKNKTDIDSCNQMQESLKKSIDEFKTKYDQGDPRFPVLEQNLSQLAQKLQALSTEFKEKEQKPVVKWGSRAESSKTCQSYAMLVRDRLIKPLMHIGAKESPAGGWSWDDSTDGGIYVLQNLNVNNMSYKSICHHTHGSAWHSGRDHCAICNYRLAGFNVTGLWVKKDTSIRAFQYGDDIYSTTLRGIFGTFANSLNLGVLFPNKKGEFFSGEVTPNFAEFSTIDQNLALDPVPIYNACKIFCNAINQLLPKLTRNIRMYSFSALPWDRYNVYWFQTRDARDINLTGFVQNELRMGIICVIFDFLSNIASLNSDIADKLAADKTKALGGQTI